MDFKHTPLIWDTGATHGLTPFLKDFFHYRPCDIPVKDTSKVNRVIGVGTIMYKFVQPMAKVYSFLECLFTSLPLIFD